MENNTNKVLKGTRLLESVIERIRGQRSGSAKAKLAIALNVHENSIDRLLRTNEINSSLTKAAAIEIICSELELTQDTILDIKIEENENTIEVACGSAANDSSGINC